MTTSPAPTSTPALDRFFDTLRRSSVTRSHDRVVAGVCSGVAQRLGVSTAIVRLGAVVLALFGPGVFLYLAACLLLPGPDGRIRLEGAARGGEASSIVLLIVTALALFPDVFGHAHLGPVPFIALGVLAVVGLKKGWFGRGSQHYHRHQTGRDHLQQATTQPPAAPSAPPSSGPQDAPRI